MATNLLVQVLVLLSLNQKCFGGSNKLMLILIDGFRWNYFELFENHGFKTILENGVKAEYMNVDFPSMSLPNYYSVLTGLHVESHGMVGNNIYDNKTRQTLDLGNASSWYQPIFWQGGEPIWIAAERQGKRSHVYYWMGCEVSIKGSKPTLCEPYFYHPSTQTRPEDYPDVEYLRHAANRVVESFEDDSADFAAIYIEAVDHIGHLYGPNSPEIKKTLVDLDKVVGEIINNLTTKGLKDTVSVLMVSDHGMTGISPYRIVNLTDVIDTDDLETKILDAGPVVQIWPKYNKIDKVYNDIVEAKKDIQHFQVYRKEDIPDKWHFKHHHLISPIVLLADPGYMIIQPYKPLFPNMKGYHGFDPSFKDMKGLFLAFGAALKENTVISPVHITDIYQLMCNILQIKPEANNGTWSSIAAALRETSSGSSNFGSIVLLMTCLLLMIW